MKHPGVADLALTAMVLAGAGCEGDPVATPSKPNHSPVLTAIADTSATVGSTLHLTAIASDPDGDPIRYHLTVYIRGINDPLPDVDIDHDTGAFVFRPAASDRPMREFIVDVSDGRGGTDETHFTVTVE